MNKKKWLLNILYLLTIVTTFSLSIFKMDNQVWLAAWIGPIFLMRFMRNNKWVMAVISGFIALQLADFISKIPLFSMMTSTSLEVDFLFILTWQLKSGALFAVPLFLIPFILDKALYKRLPGFLATLIYPAAVVAVELLGGRTLGKSQFALRPLVITCSLFGISGLSFLIAWSASMINYLWDKEWNIKKLGYPSLVYIGIMAVMLIYGATEIAFPQKAEKTVPLAGITLDHNIIDRISDFKGTINELLDLNPDQYARFMSSPQSHIDEMRRKTLAAAEAGAKIIVWQETPLALESSVADNLLLQMKNLADEKDIYLLVSYERLLSQKEKKDRLMKNIGVLFTPDGKKAWEYAKAFPTPGMEDLVTEAGSGNIPYLDTPYGRISQVICADTGRAHYMRQAAEKNIDLLFVPALDTIAHTPLYSFSSAFRAVENGFTMVRITGDGYSTVIDPYYRQWAGQNSFEQGTTNFYFNVPVVSRKTFYTTIGFIFPYIIALLLISLIVLAIIRVKK